ncbi:MAG: hypothetical protein HUU35_19795, partial [Armatimonadetes bacterium]|nr:hypothetical protein [Armatimonadota bacterium]
MAVLLLALLGASLGGEVYRDGLRGGPPLLAADWTPLRGQWEAVGAGLVGGPDESLALLHAVPPLTEGRVAVTVTPRQRVRRDGWAVAGLLLRESAERFWQLGLVADPDHKTYRMELLE